MAYTRTWQSLINLGSRYGKGIPLGTVNTDLCDMVSQDMHNEYPWKQTITNTASGAIPLIDSIQDYTAAAPNIMRMVKAWLKRTDVTPFQTRDLDVQKDLSVDLTPRSWMAIRAVSLQQSVGLFRLDAAVNMPTGTSVELCVDYQMNPILVTDLNQIVWFPDNYAIAALEGLLYFIYKLGDDNRAGGAQTDATGRATGYTGQLGTYKAALQKAKTTEEYGFTESIFPSEPMGLGRDANSLNIFGNP